MDSAVVPEVDLTYMFNPRWGVEVVAATAQHDLATSGGAIGGLDAGSVWVLPPTVTLRYQPPVTGSLHPYLGVAVNYTTLLQLRSVVGPRGCRAERRGSRRLLRACRASGGGHRHQLLGLWRRCGVPLLTVGREHPGP